MKKIISFLTILTLGILSAGSLMAQDKIKIGTTSGADVAFLEKAAEVAARDGLEVQIIEFSDYVQPNLALASKDIDLNSFQHKPYLESFSLEHKLNLIDIGATYVAPMGIYSNSLKSLDELKKGDRVAIPSDATNEGRALLLLQKAGVIRLKESVDLAATPYDIAENKLNLKFVELEAAMTPRALEDVAVAAINNTFATPAGLNPLTDAIYLEDADSPYVNVIVARAEDKDNPLYHKFVKAYQSQEVADLILARDKGATLPAFEYKK